MLKDKLVVHIVTKLGIGGMENGIVNLANNHNKTKFKIVICCLNEEGEMAKRLNNDVKLYVLGNKEGFSFNHILKVAKILKKIQPDIVHTHGWGGGSFYGIIAAKLVRVPVIINGEHGAFFEKKYQILIQRIISLVCDINLAVSESLKLQIKRTIGINPFKITVIPNGVDHFIFSGAYNRNNIKKELQSKYDMKIDRNCFVIGCVGSLKYEKNQMFLLEALSKINNNNSIKNIYVLFAGVGPDLKKLKEYCIENKIDKFVVFLGARNDMPNLFSFFDVLISVSISKHEGLSNVILEAMASGLPIISTNSIGSAELIKEGCNGYLVKEDDIDDLIFKIEYLFKNRKICNKMGESSKIYVKNKYSIEKMLTNYESLYMNC